MESENFLPSGHHPRDQARGTKPPVDFQLERLRTHLTWIDEHFLTFKKDRASDPHNAERELVYLESSINDARKQYDRLVELLEAGYQPSTKHDGDRIPEL